MPEEKKDGNWSERITGTLDDDKVITVREGKGEKEGQTLVGGGELSGSGLDKAHDHFGSDLSKESDHGNLANAPTAADYTKSDDQSTAKK